jgi:cobalt-zinc-cadmium efflux system protein
MSTHTSPFHETPASKRLIIGIALNSIFIIAEVFFGFYSNSIALLSDAGHNFGDVITLFLTLIGLQLANQNASSRFTYGKRKSTILIALLNTILLLLAVGFIIREAVLRFGKTVEIESGSVIFVAATGIIVNAVTAWLFVKNKNHDLNIRSAFVHFAADALVSLGVVISGIVMLLTGWLWADVVVSIVIAVVILYSTFHLLVESINLALDGVPESVDINEVRKYFDTISTVTSYHDLHVWALSTTSTALTVHLETNLVADNDFFSKINADLLQMFGIEHVTIQVENALQASGCGTDCSKNLHHHQ